MVVFISVQENTVFDVPSRGAPEHDLLGRGLSGSGLRECPDVRFELCPARRWGLRRVPRLYSGWSTPPALHPLITSVVGGSLPRRTHPPASRPDWLVAQLPGEIAALPIFRIWDGLLRDGRLLLAILPGIARCERPSGRQAGRCGGRDPGPVLPSAVRPGIAPWSNQGQRRLSRCQCPSAIRPARYPSSRKPPFHTGLPLPGSR